MNQSHKKNGFTLIELMLAMAFISALLLAIAMTVIQIGNIYNRGITYKNVNTAGGSIANELQRSINGSTPFELATKYKTQSFGGRLCTGQYSYIWNYGASINNTSSTLNRYTSPNSNEIIRFVKVSDSTGRYCTSTITNDITKADAVELLNEGQNNLVIHKFSITQEANDLLSGQTLYSISFTLGTNEAVALYVDKCRTANDVNSNTSYCAINKFDIVARAGNKE